MNISHFTRLTGLLLVAGFFFSCSSSKVSVDDLIANNNYQQAVQEIDKQLQENPNQPALLIQKGELNAIRAGQTDPEVRTELYSNADDDFEKAVEAGATNAQQAVIDSLRQQYWKDEHNAGVRISDNEEIDHRYQRAAIHFQNALILQKNAICSYKNLSIAQFNLGNLDEATHTLEQALQYVTDAPADIFENLGYLYLEKGEAQKAAHFYEQANKNITDDTNLAFGLINAYIANKNSEKAAKLLEDIIQKYPNNANFRNVYGTQLYQIASQKMDDLKTAYTNNNSARVQQILAEAKEAGEEAETQLVEAFKKDSSNTDYLESLAVFYNNLSSKYLALLPVAFTDNVIDHEEKAYRLIDSAITYYKKLTDINPNNEEYNAKLKTLRTLKEGYIAAN